MVLDRIPLTEKQRAELAAILEDADPGTDVPPSALGQTVGMREAFPDYHRKLRVVTDQIDHLARFVAGVSPETRNAVWKAVYLEAMPGIRDKLTILTFGRLPTKVRLMLDDPAYMRVVCAPGPVGAAARNRLRRLITDLVVAPSTARLLERATERPSVPVHEPVERLEVD